ncbi:GGDEF domain-containing protein [Patulibacter sp.]|uniref:GGDEF domain-containing protein n=1 Tax=Patulibacter sp. TaxID=1912859 RepID=UPI002719065C|nr:GGDEF domain-containing protein [Patulibacter sp.]MDO9410887.1 GGDEF domain-containing protein [Patulibacter sp.]
MSTLNVAANVAIAVPYGFIAFFILQGLVRQHQLRSNPLGLATALIFFSCSIGHAFHAVHALHAGHGSGMASATPAAPMVLWDAGTACIAVWYLSMRRRYGQLLRGPAMFDDPRRAAEERRAIHAATHDDLTGLANRAHLLETVRDRLDPLHGDAPVVVAFIDLDGFKAVNDTYGHRTGDELLLAVAGRLTGSLRSGDLLGRLGGDEFVVLFRGVPLATATTIAERLLDDLGHPFELPSTGVSVTVTASAGLACATPGTQAPTALIEAADRAMYRAKVQGGARCAVAS